MADQVEEVKQKTDIVGVIGEHLDLKKAGRNYKANCPFHGEKTPSFMVSPELQIFKCFGCGESGDVISFLQKYEGMQFYEALQALAEKAGIKLKPMKNESFGKKERLYDINSLVQKFYSYILFKHKSGKPVLEYLQKDRGLELETIKTFKLGFSPDVPLALKSFVIEKHKVKLDELEEAGIVYKKGSSAYDRFRGRVVFPLFDHRNNVVGFAGRVLPGNDKLAKYINTPETPIYHKSYLLYGMNLVKQDIREKKEAVIVEGELDMISTWQAGIKNVVAIKGSALTLEQVKLLSRFADKMVLALDADIAGDKAAKRGIQIAQDEGFEIRVAELGDFKDPDDAARENPKVLEKAITEAKNVWDFLVDSVFDKYEEVGGREKAKISQEIVPILNSITDKIVQAHYIDLVSKRLSVPPEAVSRQLRSTRQKNETKIADVVPDEPEKTRRERMEEHLLSAAFRSDPSTLLEIDDIIRTPFAKKLISQLEKFLKDHKFDLKEFANFIPRELKEGFSDIVLKDIKGLEEAPPSVWEREYNSLLYQIRLHDLKEQLEEVAINIKKYEKEKNQGLLRKEEEKFGKLTRMLNELEAKNYKGIIQY